MRVSKRNVLANHYGSRISLIFMILLPVFGILILLSVLGVLPKFPLTETMSILTGSIILGISILISLFCFMTIRSNIKNIDLIISKGEEVTAIIKQVDTSKHAITVRYTFNILGENREHSIILSKQIGSKRNYYTGNEIKIYVMKDDGENIKSTLCLFT